MKKERMEWEDLLQALCALDRDTCLRMRKPGDWYVSHHIEVGGDGCLSGIYGNGASPELAVLDDWAKLVTSLRPDRFLVIDAMRDTRRQVRWNGYMWEDVPK